MLPELKNLYEKIPDKIPDEIFEEILRTDKLRIERIISKGQKSPEGFWYDQDENEFVLLLKGYARLEFEDGKKVELREGDYLIIPSRLKHRVDKTSAEKETIWLAIFY
ncbi:cupin domain-containing protein [Melioribacter sp. OK-6-Me]|uniref:cupin domain-containing protein n=1 Tax=unclassified Melioribacter TaxID=2627329 RepID=UPI003EDAEBB0